MYELIYTSAKIGLVPGKSGFTSVAWTVGMPPMYVGILEGLSSYDPVYPPGHPQAKDNPVNYSYRKIPFGRKTLRIFSRIAYAGLDYSGRSNIIAHHIIAEESDNLKSLPLGPVSVFLSPKNFRTHWDEQPHTLPPRTIYIPSMTELNSSLFQGKWAALFGSAEWASLCARKYVANQKTNQSLYCVFPQGAAGDDVLHLLAETVGHIPPEQRDDFTFSSYFSRQPGSSADANCLFRCVLPTYKYLSAVQRIQPQNVISTATGIDQFRAALPPVTVATAPDVNAMPVAAVPVSDFSVNVIQQSGIPGNVSHNVAPENADSMKKSSPQSTIRVSTCARDAETPLIHTVSRGLTGRSTNGFERSQTTSKSESEEQGEFLSELRVKTIVIRVAFAVIIILVAIIAVIGFRMSKGDDSNEEQNRQNTSTPLTTRPVEEIKEEPLVEKRTLEERQDPGEKKEKLEGKEPLPKVQPQPPKEEPEKPVVKPKEKAFQPTPKQQYDLLIALLKACDGNRCVVESVGKGIPEIAKTEPDKLFVAEDGSVSTKEVAFHFKDGSPSYTLKIKDIDFGKKEFLGCIPKYKKPQPEDVTLLEKYHFITVVKCKTPDIDYKLLGKYNNFCDKIEKEEKKLEKINNFQGYSKRLGEFEGKLEELEKAVKDMEEKGGSKNVENPGANVSSNLEKVNVSVEDLNQELEKLEGKMEKLSKVIPSKGTKKTKEEKKTKGKKKTKGEKETKEEKETNAKNKINVAKGTVSKLIEKDSKDRSEKDLNEAKQKVNAARDAVRKALEASNIPFEDEDISTNANSPAPKQAQKPSGNDEKKKKKDDYNRLRKLRDETLWLYIQLCQKSTEQLEYSLEEISLHEKWRRIQSALDRLTNAELDKYLDKEQQGGSNQELERTAKDELGKIGEKAMEKHAENKKAYDELKAHKKDLEVAKTELEKELQKRITDKELLKLFQDRMEKNEKIKYGDSSWPELQEWLENHVTYEKYQRR